MNSTNQKKGQAAIEFLTTYGWALAVLLVMISAMSFFGVTNPDRLINDRCIAPTGFICEDFQLDGAYSGSGGSVRLRFKNNLGHDINIIEVFNQANVAIMYTDSGMLSRSSNMYSAANGGFVIGSGFDVTEGSLTVTNAGLFGKDLFEIRQHIHDVNGNLDLEQGSVEKVYVDIYYYRTRSGINFNKKATFELIGTVG